MRFLMLATVATWSTLVASPAQSQGLIEPDWRVIEHPIGCELVAIPPAETGIAKVDFGYFRGVGPIKHITVDLLPETKTGPADLLFGINGNPPVTSALRFYPNTTGSFSASVLPDPDIALGEAIRSGADGVLRLGGHVLSMTGMGEALGNVENCGERSMARLAINREQYPVMLDLLALPDDAPTSVRKMSHTILSVIGPQDYPQKALRREEQGTVRVVLLLDPKGKVDECVIASSASELLDDATCRAIKSRVKVEPVRDASGNPVGAVVFPPPMSWSIPSF